MKKLIAISVVFALAVGVAFAVDLSGSVTGVVDVIDTSFVKDGGDPTLKTSGYFKVMRLNGAGETGDGKFGAWIRLDPEGGVDAGTGIVAANVWWKPIDQFKMTIGGTGGDGIWGKEGVTGWSFNQMANDGIATNPGIWYGWNGWGPGQGSIYGNRQAAPMYNRWTFFDGFVGSGLMLEIKPFDVLGVNLALPVINGNGGKGPGKTEDVFKAIIAQVDLNFDFGNIALTYDGGGRAVIQHDDEGALFLYYGGSFGDLSIDFGFSFHFSKDWDVYTPPLGIGFGLKYASGAFGIKFKATVALGGEAKFGSLKFKEATYINTSLNPYFAINDSLCVFLNMGLAMVAPDSGDAAVGFFVNPYLRVGGEWGPSFYVGINLESELAIDGKKADGSGANVPVRFNLPIALMVSF
jgi:hypothetical protein